MGSRAVRRVPGIRFEAPPPQVDEVLPRMDIAAFVGFAETGPTHVPVAIESIAEFAAIFGGDAPLAWDPRRGEIVSARLAPAIRAFFRNGGRRCWVVRAAGRTSPNFFPIPGLARLSAGVMAPAFARGRADGSWSDDVVVGSAIAPAPVDVTRVARAGNRLVVDATVVASDDVSTGDLLRLELANDHIAIVAVEEARIADGSFPADRTHLVITGRAAWFRRTMPALPSSPLSAVAYTAMREPAGINDTFATPPIPILNAPSTWSTSTPDGSLRLDLQMDLSKAPQPGALLSVVAGTAQQLWLSVRTVGAFGDHATGTDRVRVSGPGLWFRRTSPAGALVVTRADRLALELWARRGQDQLFALRDLGLVPEHARYWPGLKHDDEWYGASDRDVSAFGELASERQFPLAGAGPADAIYLPIDVALTPGRFLSAVPPRRTALERDGLDVVSPALFVDPDLITPLTERVQAEAERVRYTAQSPRPLKGVHALMEIDEATIVAAPDATHRGWKRIALDPPEPPQASPIVPAPPFGTFLSCGARVVDAPDWAARFESQTVFQFDSGTYTLEWEGHAGDTFVVEEAHRADWSDAVVAQSGGGTRLNVFGRPPGVSYYRVRAVVGNQTSNWSRGVVVVVAGADAWHVVDEREYAPDSLLVVQRALLRMAAARGDLLALLSLPEHYRPDDVSTHVDLLTAGDGPAIAVPIQTGQSRINLPLGLAEARSFSYGALYHPWLLLREQADGAVDRVPPDGSIAGLLAQRALTRGAWIAPANDALAGVVAASPPVPRDAIDALLERGINVIQQTTRGFLPQSANTLSDDADLAPINVRRLLSLLRRLALREGSTYLFEPNDPAFERSVQRGFENLLTFMFERGAFAGSTSTSAFQVNTGGSLNTRQSIEAGRFVVELRVAPSLPMSFITVRLVQSGDRSLVTEER